jgi:NhaP-type Na+/H+ or K+/H+ antiporter
MPLSDRLLLAAVIALFISWPVFFFLIRRYTQKTGEGAGWRHAAFLFGPPGAIVIFLLLTVPDLLTSAINRRKAG